MNSMRAQAVLVFLVLFFGTVKAQGGDSADVSKVSFWKEKFTMTCPGIGDWYHNREEKVGNDTEELVKEYSAQTRGEYFCKYKDDLDGTDKYYYFYVQGKACANCFELDASLILVAVIADVLLTMIVMIVIYLCVKKKNPPGPQTPKAPARSRPQAESAQPSHYEPLRNRNQDVYNTVHKTG